MNRKHNPMVSLAALLLLATILVWICAGCTDAQAAATYRFTEEFAGHGGQAQLYIITDTETGQQYILVERIGTNGNAVDLTPLLPGEVPHG